jgi:hypothetical protein
MNNQKGSAIAVVLITIVVLSILWLVVYVPIFGFHWNTGEGSQVGYVSAVEKGGIFFKTGTAYIKPTLESTQEDDYCITDENVFAQLKEASLNKKRVEVSHFSWFSSGIKNCNAEGAIISAVKVLE